MAISVANITESAATTANTSHTVNFTQTTGDLVIVFFATNTAVTVTLGDSFTDWTSVNNTFHVFYKQLDGSEGGTLTVTPSASCKFAAVAYNIQGYINTGSIAISTVATGTSTGPDADNISPSWGTTYINSLFITAFGQAGEEADDDTWVTGTPTNYGSLTQITTGIVGTAGANCQMASAHRIAAVASEDAGAFTTAQSLAWRAYTVAVRPEPTVAVTGTITPSAIEANIVSGGKTIILTLTDEQWIAAGAGSFGAQRQNIINGLDSAQSEATGWDAVVKANQSVSGVSRTSDSVCTITLDAFATYNITATETITVAVPDTAVVNYGNQIIKTNAFTVTAATVTEVLPGVGAITLTGYSPTIETPRNVLVGIGEIALTGYPPSVVSSSRTEVEAFTGEITLTGYAPAVSIRSSPASGLYIDGYAADLSPDIVVAITIQQYNPINPTQIRVTYSNRFNLPLTNNNRRLIGLSDSLESQSQVLKELLPIRYVQNGVELIPNGSLKVIEITQKTIECAIFSDLDFYSIISNKNLTDLDYTDINPSLGTSEYTLFYNIRNDAEIAGGSGEFFTALINLGLNVVNNGGTIEYVNYNTILSPFTDVGFVPIFFGYKQVLQRIFDDAGYAYDWGKLFDGVNDNPKFNSLAIMQNGYSDKYRFQYSQAFRDEYEFSALVDADETFSDIGATGTRRFFFKNEVKTSDYYDPDASGSARSRYVPVNSDTSNPYFSGMIRFRGVVNRTGSAATVQIFLNGTALTGGAAFSLSVGDNTVDISSPYTGTLLKDSDIVEIGYTQDGADPCSVTYYAGGEFSLEVLGGPFNSGTTYLYLNQILPEVSQLEVFKDFLFRFGQIPKFSGKSVSFKSLKDILDDPTSVNDWTGKRNKNMGSHEVHLELGQRNYFQYVTSDEFTSEGFRQGYFDIDDTTLPKEQIYTSIWSSTFDALTEGIKTGQLNVQKVPNESTLTSFSYDTGFRLLLTRQKYDTEPDVVWGESPDDTPQTDYTVATFSKVDTISYERSLGYDQVLKEWYTSDGTLSTGFLNRLKDAKVVTRYYYLTETDVYLLDSHKMIFDDGVYFMFPVVKDFVSGKLTEVEMLKI